VTFHNEENGFCVLRVKARGKRDLITVVGHAATISAGELSKPAVNGATTARMASSSAHVSQSHAPTTVEGSKISGLRHDPRHRPCLREEARWAFRELVFDVIEPSRIGCRR